jgi:DNA-directed RNA polymerase specialized sigma24 family protein
MLTAREGALSSLTPIDPQSNVRATEKPEKLASTSPSPNKWTPTQQSFEKLLAAFSSDRDEAGGIYLHVRLKLLRYFERNGVGDADRCVDITLDRSMRRLDEGEVIANIMGFIYTVANYIRMEDWTEQKKLRDAETEIKSQAELKQRKGVDENPRQFCLERCLGDLPVETRKLIRDYYSEEGSAKIRLRRQMAKGLGIEMNALRLRAHRIRLNLENCVKECVSQHV